MLGILLTDEDRYLLNIIYKYGGYIRVKYLKYLYSDMSETTYFNKLEKLEKALCLIKRRFVNNSKREPVTYQITQAGCNICGNINSTYRRKRPPEYAYRALLKMIFFLEVHDTLENNIIYNVNERRKIFDGAGFKAEYFPKKTNQDKINRNDVSIVQFEEYFIDFRHREGKYIKCGDEILYTDDFKGVVIVYIDQVHIEISKQITTLVNRYINMIYQYKNDNIGFRINFLVVIDSDQRYNLYNDYLKKFLINAIYQERISDKLLILYVTFYEKLAKKDSEFNPMSIECKTNYRKGILRKNFIERGKNFSVSDKDRIEFLKDQIKAKGIKYLSDEIYNIVKVNESNLNYARLQVEILFDETSYLEYINEIYLGDMNNKLKYDIKLYKTKTSIYY